MSVIVITCGLTTSVLGERFKERVAPILPEHARDAWWQRTDYGWACSACPGHAGADHPTLDAAKQDAEAHVEFWHDIVIFVEATS